MEKPAIFKKRYVGTDSSPALKGKRKVFFDSDWVTTKIYDMYRLDVGNTMYGPAIIEAEDTTVVVSPTYQASVDEYLNIVLEAKEGPK